MIEQRQAIFVIGINHKSTDLGTREKFFLRENEIDAILPRIMANHPIQEALLLSTCNRLELLGVSTDIEYIQNEYSNLFKGLKEYAGASADLKEELTTDKIYLYTNRAAVAHLFRVVASLDSLVVGETQITGQFKQAFYQAKKLNAIGSLLSRLGHKALATSKKIRTHTDIGRGATSISHVAVDLITRTATAKTGLKVLIIGGGHMAAETVKYIRKYENLNLYLANRTPRHAQKILLQNSCNGSVYDLKDLNLAILEIDVIICCTAAKRYLLTKSDLDGLKRCRSAQNPLIIVDISLPRNIDPKVALLDHIVLYEIDDLRRITSDHVENRKQAARQAEKILTEDVGLFMNWLKRLPIGPALSRFQAYLDDLVVRETKKSLKKSIFQGLNESQILAIKELGKSITRKISRDVGQNIHLEQRDFVPDELAKALNALFPPNEISNWKDKRDDPKSL